MAEGFTVRAPALEGERGFSLDELVFECGSGGREADLFAELEGASLVVKVEARDETSGKPTQLVLIRTEGRLSLGRGSDTRSELERSIESFRHRAFFGGPLLDPGG